MIPRTDLARLKALLAAASSGPLVVTKMGMAKSATYMLSSKRPVARVIGTINQQPDAEFIAAAWAWLPRLIEDAERRA